MRVKETFGHIDFPARFCYGRAIVTSNAARKAASKRKNRPDLAAFPFLSNSPLSGRDRSADRTKTVSARRDERQFLPHTTVLPKQNARPVDYILLTE